MGESRVRPRVDADLTRCAEILVRVHGLDGYPVEGVADPLAHLHPEGLVAAWVAELGGDVVGHIALTRAPAGTREEVRRLGLAPGVAPLGMPCRLFVDPEARGSGAGRRLLETATAQAEASGMALVLDVMLKDAAAIRLYERLGWRALGDALHDGGANGVTPCRWYAWERA